MHKAVETNMQPAFWILLAFGWFATARAQVTCYRCNTGRFNGNPSSSVPCYDNVTYVSNDTSYSHNAYCLSTFTLVDGISTSANRHVAFTTSDFDLTTTGVPSFSAACTIDNSGGVTCSYPCSGNNCNVISTKSLKSCAFDCVNGYCNYFTGTCTCYKGYTGTNCSTPDVVRRSCVQCTQEIDGDSCATKTTGSRCPLYNPAAEVFCTTIKTTLFDPNGAVVVSRITRGCTTTNKVQDQCSFSNPADPIFLNFAEETCTSTCSTDNCNTGTLSDGQSKSLYCVQCNGTGASSTCYTSDSRTPCPTTANQCYSKVVYYQSNKTDLRYTADPDIRLASVERGCRQSDTTVKSCARAQLENTNSEIVTCEESCSTDGCNDHWPARSKCSRCQTSEAMKADGYDECLYNPPSSTKCDSPAHAYCYITEQGRDEDMLYKNHGSQHRSGYTHDIVRGCSFYDRETKCSSTTVDNVKYSMCNKTCSTDGCNQGSGSSYRLLASTFILLPPALLLLMR